MSLVIIGTIAYDAIETPFGKTDKIVGGAATYAGLADAYLYNRVKLVGVVGEGTRWVFVYLAWFVGK